MPLKSLSVAVLATLSVAGFGQRYRVHYVDDLTVGWSESHGIGEGNQVVGFFVQDSDSNTQAFEYDGTFKNLTPGDGFGEAFAINSSGLIAGWEIQDGVDTAVVFGNQVTNVGSLGGPTSEAYGINDSGQVAGSAELANGSFHAFLNTNGIMTDLGTLGRNSDGRALNNSGEVVGLFYLSTTQNAVHAFRYAGGYMTDLGTFGGPQSWANDVNNLGAIVGTAQDANGHARGFLYADNSMSDLGTLGGLDCAAAGLNDLGEIVGSSDLADNRTEHAFLYRNGAMLDLDSLSDGLLDGLTLTDANDINNAGWIAADVTDSRGLPHAVLLEPEAVPEPASVLCLGAAIATFALRRRRK